MPTAGFPDGGRSLYYIDLGKSFRRKLLAWYRQCARPLPWRDTRDPYAIWVSEIMLQQTRAAVVIPYYHRFLDRYPNLAALAAADEPDLLASWAGLGYYSRARNMRLAAREIAGNGGSFPADYQAIRALPGIGDYTAAAVASIAFDQPYAAVDGNVMRVISRLTADAGDIQSGVTRQRLRDAAAMLLDKRAPGQFNQAMMELGATVCLPRRPRCEECPVRDCCEALHRGIQAELPVKSRRMQTIRIEHRLLVVERNGRLLMWQRQADDKRMAGFWELPEASQLASARVLSEVGSFKHTITNHLYSFIVVRASIGRAPKGFSWMQKHRLVSLPISTVTHKALRFMNCEI